MKRGLAGKRDEYELEVKLERLQQLKYQEKKGEISLRYLDEVGFYLTQAIPYGWQEKGEKITLKSQKNQRLNVLILLNDQNNFVYEFCRGNTKSERVIRFLDEFSKTLKTPTVILLDQASIHTSDKLIKHLETWRKII